MTRLAMVFGFLVVILGITTVAALAHSGSVKPGVIHGCMKNSGQLFVIHEGEECSGSQTPVDWNAVGPQGIQGDQGVQGDQGAAGIDGTDGSDGIDGAVGPAGSDATGLTYIGTFNSNSSCLGNENTVTGLIYAINSFSVPEDSKIFIEGSIQGITTNGSRYGNVQINPSIDGVLVPNNSTCARKGDP